MISPTKILLTGASGVMGRVLCQKLLDLGFSLRVLVIENDPNIEHLNKLTHAAKSSKKSLELVTGNICEPQSLKKIIDGVDFVYHLAGLILSDKSEQFFEVNTYGTKNLVNELQLEENRTKKKIPFIYVSSASVTYSNLTAYAKSKVVAEKYLSEQNIDWTIIRPTLVCDQGGSVEFNLFLNLLNKSPVIPFPGGGKALKQPILTDDLVSGLISLVQVEKTRILHKIYNFSGGESLSLKEMAKLCVKHLNKRVFFVPIPIFLSIFIAKVLEKIIKKPASPKQALAGFLENADLDNSLTKKDLYFNPRGFKEFVEDIFPRV